jgi:hypothetical protein
MRLPAPGRVFDYDLLAISFLYDDIDNTRGHANREDASRS